MNNDLNNIQKFKKIFESIIECTPVIQIYEEYLMFISNMQVKNRAHKKSKNLNTENIDIEKNSIKKARVERDLRLERIIEEDKEHGNDDLVAGEALDSNLNVINLESKEDHNNENNMKANNESNAAKDEDNPESPHRLNKQRKHSIKENYHEVIQKIHLEDIKIEESQANNPNYLYKLENRSDKARRFSTWKSYDLEILKVVFYRFFKLINLFYDGDATFDEFEFLVKIIKKEHIIEILKNKFLDLKIRVELLKFYRMCFIDVTVTSANINEYYSIFINPIVLPLDFDAVDDAYHSELLRSILEVNKSLNFKPIINFLKYELKNSIFYLNYSIEIKQSNKIRNEYIEKGILTSLSVFMNIYTSMIYKLDGMEFVSLFEICVYFLRLKNYLITNEAQFIVTDEDYHNNLKITNRTKEQVLKDYNEVTKSNDEIFNSRLLILIYERNINGMLESNSNAKTIKEIFTKKNDKYLEELFAKQEEELKQKGLLKHEFEKNIFDIITKYMRIKENFSESSLVKNLQGQIINLDTNYGSLLLKNIIKSVLTQTYSSARIQNLYNLLKLLQYDTEYAQEEIQKLYENFDFVENGDNEAELNQLINNFFINFISLSFGNMNPTGYFSISNDYLIAMNIIKIFKYLCEGHNQFFQNLLFMKLRIPYLLPNRGKHGWIGGKSIKRNIVETKSKKYKEFESNISSTSLFNFLMAIVSKILVLSKWERVKIDYVDNNIGYFYDIFFAINELMIEMVQGTKSRHLKSLLLLDDGEQNFRFYMYIKGIHNMVIHDDCDNETIYSVRKDLMDFLMAFIEEKNTPYNIISIIKSVINPYEILNGIINTLKKFFVTKQLIKKTEELNNVNIPNKEKEEIIEQLNNKYDIKSYKNQLIDQEVYNDLIYRFYHEDDFSTEIQFELSNRMYHYIKLLSNEYKDLEATRILSFVKTYKDSEINYLYDKYIQLSRDKKNGTTYDEGQIDLNINTQSFQAYWVIKFFEEISRLVRVSKTEIEGKVEKKEIFTVLFTHHPSVKYLSKVTKDGFYESVPRDTRFIKLFHTIQTSEYFFDEINFFFTESKTNVVMKYLNEFNYYYWELFMFCICVSINLIMIFTFKHKDIPLGGSQEFAIYVDNLSIIHVILCFVSIAIWIYSRLPLSIQMEKKIYIEQNKKLEHKLNIFDYSYIIIYKCIIERNKITALLWYGIFSGLGVQYNTITFLQAIEMLMIVNVSKKLKDVVHSVTNNYRALLYVFALLGITIFIFASWAFFSLRRQIVQLEGLSWGKEYYCKTFLYCYLTNINYGLRIDGAIGEFGLKQIWDENHYNYLEIWAYGNLFLILEIFFVLAIILGIVIDTYSQLRDATDMVENDKEFVCFICGHNKNYFEKRNINFNQHIKYEHNMWTYIEYIICLKYMDPQETNAINSYVIEEIGKQSINWFPELPQELEEKQSENSDDDNNSINEEIKKVKEVFKQKTIKLHEKNKINEDNLDKEFENKMFENDSDENELDEEESVMDNIREMSLSISPKVSPNNSPKVSRSKVNENFILEDNILSNYQKTR